MLLTFTTIVCPAFEPPATLAQISYLKDMISTSFPFPSSPHWDPSTTSTLPEDVNRRLFEQLAFLRGSEQEEDEEPFLLSFDPQHPHNFPQHFSHKFLQHSVALAKQQQLPLPFF
jgi:hypothetical protein